jgi:dihydropyrimidinase
VLDLVIKGGTVVSPEAAVRQDVGVRDGRVVLVGEPGSIEGEAARTMDADGKYVVPGGIDAHVHFNVALGPVMKAQSATPGSLASAHGGTTTFIDFALQAGDESLVHQIELKQDELAKDAPHVDYALHAMITGKASFEAIDEIREAISGGISSFKMFTTFSGDSAVGGMFTDDGRMWGVMEQSARHGAIVMVHCEDDCIIDWNVRKLYREGRQEPENIWIARPNLCEEAAMSRVLLLAKRSGAPIYIVHVSTREGVEMIAEARGKRQTVYGESLHNYLAFNYTDYQKKPNGMAHHNYPSLKSPEDQEAIWHGVRSSILDTVASDDFTIPLGQKMSGTSVDTVPGGHNGIETRMAYMFSEGVHKGRIDIQRYVDITAAAPAKLFGLYPRKGVIAPGSDADIVLIDPDVKTTVRLEDLHSDCDYSLWDGREMIGHPMTTILRGMVLVDNGQWVGAKNAGRFVPCGLPGEP